MPRKILMDFFQIGISLLFEEDLVDDVGDSSRMTMEGGLENQSAFKNDGVNRCLLVLITPWTKEDYDPLKVCQHYH